MAACVFLCLICIGAYRIIMFRSVMGHANQLYMTRHFEEAAAEYQRAYGFVGASGYSHLYRGEALLFLGRPEEAKAEMDRAVGLEPEDAHCRVRLAAALIECRDLSAAETQIRKALTTDPHEGEGHFILAKLMAARKRYNEAWLEFAQARRDQPPNDDVRAAMNQFEQILRYRAGSPGPDHL